MSPCRPTGRGACIAWCAISSGCWPLNGIAASAGVEQRAPRQTGAPLRRGRFHPPDRGCRPLPRTAPSRTTSKRPAGCFAAGAILEACEPCRLPTPGGARMSLPLANAPHGRPADRAGADGPVLADRSAAAHADEQPPSGGRRRSGKPRRLRRRRPCGAKLGGLRPHRGEPPGARRRRDPARAIGPAGPGYSRRMRMRPACSSPIRTSCRAGPPGSTSPSSIAAASRCTAR